MSVKSLTPNQQKVLDYIVSFYEKRGYSPSLVEISRHFELKSVNSAFQYIKSLNEKGFLDKDNHFSRSIYPKKEAEIFLLGRIAAGGPIEPIESPEPIKVPDFMIKTPGNYYALEVRGDSMIDDGIAHGDIVVVKHQNTADSGDTVVAVTPQGATLKRYYKTGSGIELRARNKQLKGWPKLFDPGIIEIRGKFTGLIRR